MRQPRTFTFHIFSSKRVSGTAGDYFVNLPGLDALVGLGREFGTQNRTKSEFLATSNSNYRFPGLPPPRAPSEYIVCSCRELWLA